MRAIVDTGSAHTLIKESAVSKLGSEINKRRNIPRLQGVTGSPLRIIGMVWLKIGVGNDHEYQQWVPVVPNRYLDAELLLGTDILGRASFQWKGNSDIIIWGDATYVVGHVKRQKGKVEKIQHISLPVIRDDVNKNVNLTKPISLEPYHSQFIPIQVNEKPNTTLLIHSQPHVSHNSLPFLTKVNADNKIYLPFVNNTKGVKQFKIGTLVGSYEQFDVGQNQEKNEAEVIHNTRGIQNDLLPSTDEANTQGSRIERLSEMIK